MSTDCEPVLGPDVDVAFRQHANSVYAYLLLRGVSGPDADDAVQEAFVSYLVNIGRVRGVRPWLCAVAYNSYRREQRAATRHQHAAHDTWVLSGRSNGLGDSRDISEQARKVVVAIEELPERQREVVRLYLANVPMAEIALALEMAPATVRSNLRHAGRSLGRKVNGAD